MSRPPAEPVASTPAALPRPRSSCPVPPAVLPHARTGLVAACREVVRLLPALLAQAARVYPRGEPAWLGRRARFLASALRHPRAHRALVDFLSRPPFDAVLQRHPRLLQKVHKPFPYRGLDVPARVALVARHYVLARERLGPALHDAVAQGRELVFCHVALPAGRGTLPVHLGKHVRFEREGELTLSLMDPFGSLLYSACFTLVDGERPGDVALLVGSLNGTAPRDVLRHITKLSHGVRPASLMVFLLQQVAAAAQAGAMRAVGRETHAYWGHPRHGRILFDYDAFWLEEGGEARPDGLFSLPAAPRRRDASDTPAQKRAQYARRYAWLDEVAADARQRWAALGDDRGAREGGP